jgi:hypothetical protein
MSGYGRSGVRSSGHSIGSRDRSYAGGVRPPRRRVARAAGVPAAVALLRLFHRELHSRFSRAAVPVATVGAVRRAHTIAQLEAERAIARGATSCRAHSWSCVAGRRPRVAIGQRRQTLRRLTRGAAGIDLDDSKSVATDRRRRTGLSATKMRSRRLRLVRLIVHRLRP